MERLSEAAGKAKKKVRKVRKKVGSFLLLIITLHSSLNYAQAKRKLRRGPAIDARAFILDEAEEDEVEAEAAEEADQVVRSFSLSFSLSQRCIECDRVKKKNSSRRRRRRKRKRIRMTRTPWTQRRSTRETYRCTAIYVILTLQ